MMTGFSFEVNDGVKTIDGLARQDPVAIQKALQQYMETKTGPFGTADVNSIASMPLINPISNNGKEATESFLDKTTSDTETSIHYDFIRSMLENPNEESASFFTFPAQGNFEIGGGSDPKNITIGVCLLHPLSRGSVHLNSGDPTQNPESTQSIPRKNSTSRFLLDTCNRCKD